MSEQFAHLFATCRLVCLVTCLVASFALPVHAAPDEAGYGAAEQYPAGDRSNWFQQRHMVGAYTGMDRLFPTREVKRGDGPVRPLPAAAEALQWSALDQYLASHPATGLLILKDGKVLAERYQYGRQPEDRFTSWSMAKTFVGMAIGVAIAEGRIASIDDAVDRYEPALKGTAWQGVSIRHVLSMSSGVKFDETYDKPGTDIARLGRAWTLQQGSLLDALGAIRDRAAEPGSRFKYVSAETQVLGQVLVKATGRTLADYVSEKIWAPMGAEADAFWTLDAAGMEVAYCCFSARLRDYARFGQLLLDGGKVNGRQLIPADWVDAATSVRFRDGHLQPRHATPYFGYGYQLWIFPDNLGFAMLGVRGQSVFVNPRLRLVMVQTAVWASSIDPAAGRQRDEFWRALVLLAPRL